MQSSALTTHPPQLTAHKQGTIFTEGREGALQIELAVRSHGIACASSMLDIAAACAQSRETRFVCDHNLYFMCRVYVYLYGFICMTWLVAVCTAVGEAHAIGE